MKNTLECEENSPHNDSTFLSSYLSLLKDTYFSIIDHLKQYKASKRAIIME